VEVFEPWRDSRAAKPTIIYLQQFVNSGFLVAIFCGLFVFFSHEERETQDSSELSPLLSLINIFLEAN
jgi:hypothetical protein